MRAAGEFIAALPKAKHDTKEWQTAIHVLIQAADHGGPMAFADIAMKQALYPKGESVYDTSRKDPMWRNTGKLAREKCLNRRSKSWLTTQC